MSADVNMAKVSDDLLGLLKGDWRFTRIIYGPQGVHQADATGMCRFSETEPGLRLHYREEGHLLMRGASTATPIAFTRLFDYLFEGNEVQVLFADGERVGQPYQRYVWDGTVLAPVAEHICGPDFYTASYRFESRDRFSMRTVIKGAKKDTCIDTLHERQ